MMGAEAQVLMGGGLATALFLLIWNDLDGGRTALWVFHVKHEGARERFGAGSSYLRL